MSSILCAFAPLRLCVDSGQAGGWIGYHSAMMRSEQDLIPYTAGRLEGSPVLVLAPHPDDEVFGCGGALVQAAKNGIPVRVVVLTDGEAQGEAETRRT